MEVLRRCPLAIAQRLVHCAIALSTAVLDRVTKTMSVAPLLMNNLDNSKQRRPTCSAQLHLPTHDLFWAKVRVQLHLPPLRSLDLLISPGALRTSTETTRLIRDGQMWLELGEGVWRRGKREIIYMLLHCHHQNDSCIKMGSGKSHFNGKDIATNKTVATHHNF